MLSLLHEAVVVLQIGIFVCGALRIDVIGDLAELGDIFVTEIGVCHRVFAALHATRYSKKQVVRQ